MASVSHSSGDSGLPNSSSIEEEFGRPLSPLECETLAIWQDQDQHDAILIKHALKEAVLSGKLSFASYTLFADHFVSFEHAGIFGCAPSPAQPF